MLAKNKGARTSLLLAALILATLPGAARALEMKPQEIQGRYRQVLATLSEGTAGEALQELHDLGTGALPRYAGSIQLERYWRLKLRVIRELLENGQLDQLIPIIVLHHDAFEMYRQRERPLLAAHSRTMATELAEILAERSQDPEAKEFAGWVLTSFGVYLQQSRSVSSSADFFRRALAMAPGNQSARLGLAAAHEKYGEYDAAVPLLERSLELEPTAHHARLRLALCLMRTGRPEPARDHLEMLTVLEDAPEWIASLAFQELARLQLEAGALGEAEATLRRALARLPDHQQPRVQLAALLEQQRRRRAAREVLGGIRPSEGGADSPRYLYDQWPTDGITEARATLQAMMESRLYLLAAGLNAAPRPGVGP